jgi:diguanylate cyclase (GGDEF)-like protein
MGADGLPQESYSEQQKVLLTARCVNLSARLPTLYAVILVNVAVLSGSFAGSAPPLLTIWLPLVLAGAIGWRIIFWAGVRAGLPDAEVGRRAVRRLPIAGFVLASLLAAWALSLYEYGNEHQRSLVHFITAVVCFTGILGMAHSPPTALAMGTAAIVPSSAVYLAGGHPNAGAVVALQAIVGILLWLVTRSHNRDFEALVLSRQDLEHREREASELAQLSHLQATRDALTGALNRRGILETFQDCLIQPGPPKPWLALIDLDGFKLINDTHGHAAGDTVLKAVSQRIAQCEGLVASGRMGGDEFALVLPGEFDRAKVGEVLDSLANEIVEPIQFGDNRLAIHASIGLHRCTGSRVSDCLERADLALYKAKRNPGTGLSEFTQADERILADKRTITRVFTSADLEHQLSLVYQPIVDCSQRRTIGFEALARWSPDGKNWLPPAQFIQLAETTGRMSDLTGMIVSRTLAECPAWRHDRMLSINLSARDILREDAAPWLAGLVDAAEAPHRHIVFELTETALLDDYRRAADTLDQLRKMGFRIALDDFGTGQSSLSHIHNLPLDHIKIDGSFAQGLAISPSARAIVGTTYMLASQLHLTCVIEGIETAEQETIARSLGLTVMQGFHFSRPVGALEALSGTQAEWRRRPTGPAEAA